MELHLDNTPVLCLSEYVCHFSNYVGEKASTFEEPAPLSTKKTDADDVGLQKNPLSSIETENVKASETRPPTPTQATSQPLLGKEWHMYNQKSLHIPKNSENGTVESHVIRFYYQCTHENCPAKVTIEKSPNECNDKARMRYSTEKHNHLSAEQNLERKKASHNVLVIEDDILQLTFLARLVRNLGYNVIEAQTANEALEIASTQDIDVALMDVCLPDIMGDRLAPMLRDQSVNRNLQIIACSANSERKQMKMCMRSGVNRYVVKPVRKEDITTFM